MFTGIVETLGKVRAVGNGVLRVEYQSCWDDPLVVGESISVSGVCLTLTEATGNCLAFNLGQETLERTTFKDAQVGDPANLERALKVGSRLGGHFVLGHVDATAELIDIESQDNSRLLSFQVSSDFSHLMVDKGSICLDGVSLTLIQPQSGDFKVMVIPHTWENTTLGYREPGAEVNVEFDMIAKHIAKLNLSQDI